MTKHDDEKPADELNQNDELSRLRAENKRLQSSLQKAQSDQLMMKHSHDDKLDEMTDRMVKAEKENADLISRIHKQAEAVNALTTRQKLLDAGYTATLKSYAQATRDLDDTRVQSYYIQTELELLQNELDASKVHIILQDEEHTAQLQLLDELKNDLKVRDEAIHGLESRLHARDGVYVQQQQWSYPWPPNPCYHSPSFPPYYPTPNQWSQEYYPTSPHSVVQPDHYLNSSVISDQSSVISPQVYFPSESIIQDSSNLIQPDAIADSHPEKRLRDDQTSPHLSSSNVIVDSAVVTPGTFDKIKVREELPRDSLDDYTMNPLEPSSHSLTKIPSDTTSHISPGGVHS